MDRQPVDMVRVPREERLIEREAVFGRDAKSVFPTEAAAVAKSEAEATKEALGALKFVSESELEELKAQRGARVEDGSVAPSKPLAQVLLEAKEAKEAAFQDQWRQMKQGKNRPLDEDEIDFLEGVRSYQQTAEQAQREEEMRELEAYQLAVRQAAELRAPPGNAGDTSTSLPQPKQQPSKPAGPARKPAPKVTIKPTIRIKHMPAAGAVQHQQQQQQQQPPPTKPGEGPPSKRQKVDGDMADGGEDSRGGALAGLLGAYDSDEESS